MHFANDALWWRLTHPTVRELAALIFAPELWQHPHTLPHRILIGDTGFRQLLQWNDTPPTCLPHEPTAQSLLSYWLTHTPHIQLIEQNQNLFHIHLAGKAHTIELHHHPHAQSHTPLPESIAPTHLCLTRGIVFLPPRQLPGHPFHPQAWHGTLQHTWPLPTDPDNHYHPLPDPAPLAPIIRPTAYSVEALPPSTAIARMVQRPDGLWHETERFYCPTATT